jgi:hypothetical protein
MSDSWNSSVSQLELLCQSAGTGMSASWTSSVRQLEFLCQTAGTACLTWPAMSQLDTLCQTAGTAMSDCRNCSVRELELLCSMSDCWNVYVRQHFRVFVAFLHQIQQKNITSDLQLFLPPPQSPKKFKTNMIICKCESCEALLELKIYIFR